MSVFMRYFHRFQSFDSCSMDKFVIPCIFHQMPYISYIAYISYLIIQIFHISEHYVETDESAAIADMDIIVHGRTTYIHSYMGFMNRNEFFFFSADTIVNV